MFLSHRDVAGERQQQYWLQQPMSAVRFAGVRGSGFRFVLSDMSSRCRCDLPWYPCYGYNITAMAVTHSYNGKAPWLLLVFSLPTSRASQRVEVWRKLQRYGVLALRRSGYVLPNSAANPEK